MKDVIFLIFDLIKLKMQCNFMIFLINLQISRHFFHEFSKVAFSSSFYEVTNKQ